MARRLLLTCLAALLAAPAHARADGDLAAEIVVARAGGLTAAELARAEVTAERALALDGVEVVDAHGDRDAALRSLRADPDVDWAEPNRPRSIAAEPLGGLEWGLHNTGQPVWWQRGTPDADIDAPEAWTLGRGAGVTVAVVDTGADALHPDLADRLAAGWDFVEDDADPQDANGHGTHVAGTIAAAENGAGIVGVAPAARIMPLRVLDGAGQGTSADVAAAFAFAAEHGARVVNASLGSPYPSLVERRAIHDHPETLFVVAAGNGGPDGAGDDVDGATREYPCVHEEPNLVCVGATDQADAPAGFSNYGAASVDLFAPGTAIVSTVPARSETHLDRYFGTGTGYEVMQGTSMAAPHASGAAALVAGVQPGWNGGSVRAALLDGADRLPALAGRALTGGRLNAANAMARATGRLPGASPAGALGPELTELLDPAVPDAPPRGVPGARPTLSGLRVAGRPRVCGRTTGCHARTAMLSFALTAQAPVVAQLERRRCVRSRCRWTVTGSRTRTARAGASRWALGPRLLGMALAEGTWRVTLATTAGRLRRTFHVGG